MILKTFKEDEKRKRHKKPDRIDVFCNVLMETKKKVSDREVPETMKESERKKEETTMLEFE